MSTGQTKQKSIYEYKINSCVTKRDESKGSCQDTTEIISAVSFSFAPNTIDFSTVFSKFDISAQGAVLGVILALFFIFAILFVWADYMDRRGIMQV